MDAPKLVGPGHTQLRAKQIEAWVWIGLSPIGKMLEEEAQARLAVVVNPVGNAGGAGDIESEILALRANHVGVAVNPTEANAPGDVGSPSAAGMEEIVTEPDGDSVIEILRTSKNRLGHAGEIKLIVPAKKSLAINGTKTPARGDELGPDLVAVGVVDDPKHVGGLGGHLETGSIRIIGNETG